VRHAVVAALASSAARVAVARSAVVMTAADSITAAGTSSTDTASSPRWPARVSTSRRLSSMARSNFAISHGSR
jgi:hypothetical protein